MSKDIQRIQRQLSQLRKSYVGGCFRLYVDGFLLKIYTHKLKEFDIYGQFDIITDHANVDVELHELSLSMGNECIEHEKYVHLERDPRFKHYPPIKYSRVLGASNGEDMPIPHLCQLILYLEKLPNLQSFI